MSEIWKQYKDWNYEVSNTGKVRNLTTKNHISVYEQITGYHYVCLYNNKQRKTMSLHALVAACFLPKLIGTDVINHIDHNKKNNNLDNLEWVTYSENSLHSTGSHDYKENWTPPKKLQKLIDEAIKTGLLTEDQVNRLYDLK